MFLQSSQGVLIFWVNQSYKELNQLILDNWQVLHLSLGALEVFMFPSSFLHFVYKFYVFFVTKRYIVKLTT